MVNWGGGGGRGTGHPDLAVVQISEAKCSPKNTKKITWNTIKWKI
jgi:hypothetical protein